LVDVHDNLLKKVVFETQVNEQTEEDLPKPTPPPAKDNNKNPKAPTGDSSKKSPAPTEIVSPIKPVKPGTPVMVLSEKTDVAFTSVKCGNRYAVFQDENGKLYSCGYGNLGELGLGKEKTYSKSPTLIDGLDYKKIVTYSCGPAHILAVSSDAKVFAWGEGTYGKLANPFIAPTYKPKIIPFAKYSDSKTGTIVKIERKASGTPNEGEQPQFSRSATKELEFRCSDVSCGGDFSFFVSQHGVIAVGRETNDWVLVQSLNLLLIQSLSTFSRK